MKQQALGKTLKAWRMGVVTETMDATTIVGRVDEKQALEAFICAIHEEETALVQWIRGPYGSGKSLLLSHTRDYALRAGYVVASVALDGGCNLSKMDVLYTTIMNHLVIKDQEIETGTSFETIFEAYMKTLIKTSGMAGAAQTINSMIVTLRGYNETFASVLMVYMRAIIQKDDNLKTIAVSFLKGDRNMGYTLKRQLKVKGTIDTENAMAIFRGFVKLLTLIGYKGLIITLDECEFVMTLRQDIRMKAYHNMRQLMDLCGTGELSHCGFLLAGTPSLFEDQEKGIGTYEALKQRLGETIDTGNRPITNHRQPVLDLKPLHQDDWYRLLEQLVKVHQGYYDYKTPVILDALYPVVVTELEKNHELPAISVRMFIKKALEILDLAEQHPHMPIFQVKKMGMVKKNS